GCERDLGVSTLEFAFALRLAGQELEFRLGGGKKIGDHRHVRAGGFRFLLRSLRRIERLWRPAIKRRLGEHIIVERQRLPTRALGRAGAPLLTDQAPIGLGFGRKGGLRFLVLGKRAAVLGDRGGRRRRSHRGLALLGGLRAGRHHGQQDREDQYT